jgi:outer membrane protein assembly factor BamE (lipoprotein component of BamABCDE complex)
MKRTRAWASSFGCVFLSVAFGCKTPDPLGPAMGGAVREGMSQGEVRMLLGDPTLYEQAGDGRSVETYEDLRTIFGSRGVPEREEALEIRQYSVRYDPQGRVTATLYHRGVLENLTMLYSQSRGPEVTPEKMRTVRSGQTTRADLERLFGPPILARLEVDSGQRLEWIYDYIEASAVTPGRVYRALEVTVDDNGVVSSVQMVDRVFPAWRR